MLKRITAGFTANTFGHLVIAGLQLVSVPTFASAWGIEVYGIWLMLSALPFCLALGDLGVTTTAASDMTMSIARGERDKALRTFQSAWLGVMVASSCLFGIGATILINLPDAAFPTGQEFAAGEVRFTVFVLLAYGIVSLQSGVLLAGYRSNGLYALGTFLHVVVLLIEGSASLIATILGGKMLAAAIALLVGRSVGVAALAVLLRARVPWLEFGFAEVTGAEIRRLIRPSLALLALPLADALSLQGTLVIIGVAASAEAVTVFSVVRTLTRIGLQMTLLVNHATMPEFSAAAGRSDQHQKMDLVLINLAAIGLIVVPAFVALTLAGTWIIQLWTRGAVVAPPELVVAMSGAMALNALWHPIANLFLALNRQGEYAYFYLVASFWSVALSYPLTIWFGPLGAAVSLITLHGIILAHVYRLAFKGGLLNPSSLLRRIVELLRSLPNRD